MFPRFVLSVQVELMGYISGVMYLIVLTPWVFHKSIRRIEVSQVGHNFLDSLSLQRLW